MPHLLPPSLRIALLAALAMLAFAANSLLCRLALRDASIDAATFTALRLASGALVLAVLVRLRSGQHVPSGDWPSAVALFVYAAGFSWAYVQLTTATGALLLFGAVQVTMVAFGLWRGERLRALQWLGFAAACLGLVAMLLPGLAAPPLQAAGLMLSAGVAWGVYSLRGRGKGDPTAVTAGNFWRAAVLGLVLLGVAWPGAHAQPAGVAYALASGALASGLGYAIWYTALRGLTAATAASLQLTVPVLAAVGAVLFLGEAVTLRLGATSAVILGGVALVIWGQAAGADRRFSRP
jgi:drug/metabolite transporter (DMT)-like permease